MISSPSDVDLNDVLVLLNAGRLPEAERATIALASAYPRAAPVFNIFGVVQATGGKTGAETSVQTAIVLTPVGDEPPGNLGLLYFQRGDFRLPRNDVRTGGETTFRHFALSVRPERGKTRSGRPRGV